MKKNILTAILVITSLISQVSLAADWRFCASQAYKTLEFYKNVSGNYMYTCRWIHGDYYSNWNSKGVTCNISVKNSAGRVSNWSVDMDNKCRGLKSGPNSIQDR